MSIERIHKKMEWLSSNLSYLGSIALFAMMSLTTVDVVGRYFFNKPVLGAFELTEFLVLILIFSFLAPARQRKAMWPSISYSSICPDACGRSSMSSIICFVWCSWF